jgi:hypothetical protein
MCWHLFLFRSVRIFSITDKRENVRNFFVTHGLDNLEQFYPKSAKPLNMKTTVLAQRTATYGQDEDPAVMLRRKSSCRNGTSLLAGEER